MKMGDSDLRVIVTENSQIMLKTLRCEILSLKISEQLCVYHVVCTQSIPSRWEGESGRVHIREMDGGG